MKIHICLSILVPVYKQKTGTIKFPNRRQAIFRKIQEIKGLRVQPFVRGQGIPPIDDKIAESRYSGTGWKRVYALANSMVIGGY